MVFMGKHFYRLITISTILVAVVLLNKAMAKPVKDENKREKRSGISDQRLAELETLLELKRLRENLRTRTPVAYGLIDPAKIGRRRKRDHYFQTNNFDKLLARDKDSSVWETSLINAITN
ncbi:uncharacterized protein LOC128962406 [Oppia nitens]|uniref:uncharacterized protein LOC128962406 n=1 Tax=Oppia nitens TaxID=1686743 RepID=UPI0023DC9F39|nr:uncharacterized protein LOC128962406 [Oppia nitens]